MQRRILVSGVPPGFSWASTPKNQSLPALFSVLSTLLSLTGAVPHLLSLEKVNLELQLVKRNVSAQIPLRAL